MNRNNSRAIAAAIFAAFCWGSATVMSKSVLAEVSPMALLTLQLAVSAAALWSVILLTRRRLPPRGMGWVISVLGLLEPGAAYLLGLIGLVWIGAGVATLIQASEAILIVVVSVVLLGERPTFTFIMLSLIALAGLSMALGIGESLLTGNEIFGIVMMFLATASAAVYVVLSSRVIGDHDPLVVVGLQQLSALVLALLALPFESAIRTGGIELPHDTFSWSVVILSGLVQYAIAFSAYMYALSRISANLAGSFLNLTPVFGLAIAFIALREQLTLIQLAGAAVTILAVSLIHIRSEPALSSPPFSEDE